MDFLTYYYENIIKYDLLNKYNYKKIYSFPTLKKIVLNFNCINTNFKTITSALVALELISNQRSTLTYAKKPNISLKIRKGQPVGCKLILKNYIMYKFIFNLISNIIPNMMSFKGFKLKHNNINNTMSFKINNILIFQELENNYQYFKNLPTLNITIISNKITFNEFVFLLKSLKILIK